MIATRVVGPEAGARKYDLLTGLAAAALHREETRATAPSDNAPSAARLKSSAQAEFSPVTALRLIALITARYDWSRDSAAISHAELEWLWGMSRSTMIREIVRRNNQDATTYCLVERCS